MSVLGNDIFDDPIEILFSIGVSTAGELMRSRRPNPTVKLMREAILNAANNHKKWFAESVYNLKATGNDEFTSWLCEILSSAFPSWEIMVSTYVCFWYGVPEVPNRMATISIETIGHGIYQLKIIDKRFEQQYKGINPEIYDKFLSSQPTGTNGYDLLNTILNKSLES